MASWSSPRSGASRCAGPVRWRARPRRSRSSGRPMAGMSASPVRTCRCTACHPLDRRRASTWGWSPSPRSRTGHRSSTRAAIARRKRTCDAGSAGSRAARRAAIGARKAVKLLAKAHQQVKRQRQDFHHKDALKLVQQYDAIYHEDLQTANMVKNHHLAKSITDAGWSAFLSILTFKAACAGKRVVAVPPAYTSQDCCGCGSGCSKACPSGGTRARTAARACIETTTPP